MASLWLSGRKATWESKIHVKDVVFASSITLDFWIGYEPRFSSITAIYRDSGFLGMKATWEEEDLLGWYH
jgi:hypothetical protein